MQALVIDDNKINARVACAILENLGFEVMTCFNPIEALAVFRANPIFLVITDFEMPEMDGIQLTEMLRKIEHRHCKSPCFVFATSASAEATLPGRFAAAGADIFLMKPLTFRLIEKALSEMGFRKVV